MPEQFVGDFIEKGLILFRNLTYFRQYEDNRRGDPLEGFHRDNPDNGMTIKNLTKGTMLKDRDISFLNSTNTDLIFVFCLSISHKNNLYDEFETNTCIEITDADEFTRRVRLAVKKLLSTHKTGLLSGKVNYYFPNQPCDFDIHDPKNLPFAKGKYYAHQEEFRLVFGTTKKAFDLKMQLVCNRGYDFLGEAKKGNAKEKFIRIGSIQDIVKVHYK